MPSLLLRALFENPDFLKPQRTTAQVTKDLAAQIAEIAKSLQSREAGELADARTRKEMNFAQKKNLRIARFLNRVVFCFFAGNTGLLPKNLFPDIAKTGIDDPKLFAETLEKLFAVMAKGGTFGKDKIRYFNGHLFEDSTVFELTEAELRALATAGEADWQFIEPSIMGTLFERALDESQRSQLGAHYTSEREWPEADVIVGNPPFIGSSKLWEELGRHYQKELWKIYEGRVPGAADFCCYWFEKARHLIENKKCNRAGLLATQGIRGGASREVLKRIKETGDIFFAESDRDWILDGATVHVSMVGFDKGTEPTRLLDGKSVSEIHPNLTAQADVTAATALRENLDISFRGTQKSGDFDIAEEIAIAWLNSPNPHGRPNSDLLKPWLNGSAIVKRMPPAWIIDTGTDLKLADFALYEKPYAHAFQNVKPQRDENKREHRRLNWWLHAETCPGMRTAIDGQLRFLTTPRVSKFRIFDWADSVILPDDGIYIFARADDYFFGIVHSRFHEVWARSQGTQVRDRESGFRYTPNTCFETFPFPRPTPAQEAAIAAAAKELNELRDRWLNPPEWTVEKILEFPGSTGGAWQRYLDAKTVDAKTGVGTVRYPRLEPRDADCAAKLKDRTLTKLYNERPAWLDLAHKKLDAAVAAAYGWPADLTDEQILEKLLALNLERAAEETKAAKVKTPKVQRGKTETEMI